MLKRTADSGVASLDEPVPHSEKAHTLKAMRNRKPARAADKQVFVIGSDPYNESLIARIPGAENWAVIPVLGKDEVQPPSGRIDFDALYSKACKIIDDHGGEPAAIIGHLDFPVTSLVSLLNRNYGLPGATPEAVARCEHKYWLRMEQKKVLPESTPRTRAINPFDSEATKHEILPYPFWLKPVKCHSSVLGFMIDSSEALDRALHACRQKIHLFGEPFNRFLDQLDDTSELEGVDGNFAIAEEIISAPRQFTMEGYVHNGRTSIYGVIESLRVGRYASCLSSYQYPAVLPEDVTDRARAIAERVMTQVRYDNHPFNVEFFWDPESGALKMLEVNPRISKSHSPLFRMVDGTSHHKVALDLSMGREPEMPRGEGKNGVAGKFMLRSFEADGIVVRVPTDADFAELQRILPDIDANMLVRQDQRLSDLFYQDSYSYELAEIFLGGETAEVLEDAFGRCLDSLPIHIKPLPKVR